MKTLLKFLIYCLACILLIGCELQASDQKLPDTTQYYLELTGLVRDNYSSLSSADVTIYQDSVLYFSEKTKSNGKCRIKLPLDGLYTILFSMPGYVSKRINLNTGVPNGKKGIYKFLYTVKLFETIEGLDVSVLEKPVAVITFNSMMNQFDYDYNYTVLINKELEKLYNEYYIQEKKNARLAKSESGGKKQSLVRRKL